MKKTIKFAFVQTIPVLFGYLFLGTAFGLLLQRAGFGPVWALIMSLGVYAGSGQFLLVGLLASGAGLISVALMTLSVNCRHIFYGLSFIEKFKAMGKRCLYMIFSLTDETYSLLCSVKVPDDVSEKDAFFAIALFDQIYWLIGSLIGSILGELIAFNSTGVEFAMTALFVVIFIEQWLSSERHTASAVGVVCGVVSLIIFGADNFILPSLLCSVGLLIALKEPLRRSDKTEDIAQ